MYARQIYFSLIHNPKAGVELAKLNPINFNYNTGVADKLEK